MKNSKKVKKEKLEKETKEEVKEQEAKKDNKLKTIIVTINTGEIRRFNNINKLEKKEGRLYLYENNVEKPHRIVLSIIKEYGEYKEK